LPPASSRWRSSRARRLAFSGSSLRLAARGSHVRHGSSLLVRGASASEPSWRGPLLQSRNCDLGQSPRPMPRQSILSCCDRFLGWCCTFRFRRRALFPHRIRLDSDGPDGRRREHRTSAQPSDRPTEA
jgi:hypothetical protein